MAFAGVLHRHFEFEDADEIPVSFLDNNLLGKSKDDTQYRKLNLRQMMTLLWKSAPTRPESFRIWCWQERLQTLTSCGDRVSLFPMQTLVAIARAGFYHSGTANTLVCFFCGCHAHNWENSDDPLKRHAELQPGCPHVRRNVKVKMKNGSMVCRPRSRHFSESDKVSAPPCYSQ